LDEEPEYRNKLGEKDRRFLFCTSVDFVFCDPKDDRPLLCVEIDGRARGYNAGARYLQREWPNPERRRKLTLKLKTALHFGLPFFIMSYDEANDISESLRLSILDAVVGEFVVRRQMGVKAGQYKSRPPGLPPSSFEELLSDERWLAFELWRISEEHVLSLEHNPAIKELHANGLPFEPRIRITDQEGLLRLDCTLFHWTRDGEGDVAFEAAPVFVPHFDVAGCGSREIAEYIAMIAAFDEARRKGIKP
jgi:hypothetical protein